MSIKQKVASALSFAHLADIGRPRSKAAADDEDDKDKPKKDASSEEEEEEDPKKPKDNDPRAGDGEGDEEDEKAKAHAAGFSAGKAAGLSEGAAAERIRCASIFGAPAAANNVALAAELAFNSDMSAERVIAALGKAPRSAASSRAAHNPSIGPGGEGSTTARQATSSQWDRAFAKANPINVRRQQ